MSLPPFGDDGDQPLAAPRPVPGWPLFAVLAISAAAIVAVAVFRAFVPALVTYGIVLVFGCGLLFQRRRLAVAETRRAGGIGVVRLTSLDRAALAALVLACLAAGAVIALELASWDWAKILNEVFA